MTWLQYIGAGCFSLFGLACVVVTPLGLPGTWIMITVAAIVDAVMLGFFPGLQIPFGGWGLVIAILAATMGEALEFFAGALGAKAGGASMKGVLGSMIGGILGLVAGTIAIPIPLVGSVVGAVLGALVGALAGEKLHGRSVHESLRPATGAAIGRILGALSKVPFALIAWSALVWDAFT